MSHKARFVIVTLVAAAGLFALLRWLSTWWPALWSLDLATATIAVMIAAQGVSWQRKARFVGLTAGMALGLHEVARISGLGAADSAALSPGPQGATNLQLAAVVAIQVFFVAVPLAALTLFVGRRPSVLWTARDVPNRGKRRPAGSGKKHPPR